MEKTSWTYCICSIYMIIVCDWPYELGHFILSGQFDKNISLNKTNIVTQSIVGFTLSPKRQSWNFYLENKKFQTQSTCSTWNLKINVYVGLYRLPISIIDFFDHVHYRFHHLGGKSCFLSLKTGIKNTVCPLSSDPFYKVIYYIKCITTSWTDGTCIKH